MMISWSSVWALVLRHSYIWKRDINLLLCGFYWPLLDILIWGFLGSWIATFQVAPFHNYKVAALLGILLWQIVGRGCNIMIISFTEELWSNNVVNLFSLPLKTIDWVCGIVLFNAIAMFLTSVFCMSVMFFIYDLPRWYVVSTFLLFFPPLFFSSIWIGFTCLQILITWGKRGQELGFVAAWCLMPFSGAYYPIEVLPHWAQHVSAFLPMSYVFQGMRGYVMHQQDPTNYLIKGYVLSIIYAICAVLLFIHCLERSKRKGLARLTD